MWDGWEFDKVEERHLRYAGALVAHGVQFEPIGTRYRNDARDLVLANVAGMEQTDLGAGRRDLLGRSASTSLAKLLRRRRSRR